MSYITTILFVFAGLPQTFRLLKVRSSQDISVLSYLFTWGAIFLVLLEANEAVFYSNLVSILILSINIFLILLFRIKK